MAYTTVTCRRCGRSFETDVEFHKRLNWSPNLIYTCGTCAQKIGAANERAYNAKMRQIEDRSDGDMARQRAEDEYQSRRAREKGQTEIDSATGQGFFKDRHKRDDR